MSKPSENAMELATDLLLAAVAMHNNSIDPTEAVDRIARVIDRIIEAKKETNERS